MRSRSTINNNIYVVGFRCVTIKYVIYLYGEGKIVLVSYNSMIRPITRKNMLNVLKV